MPQACLLVLAVMMVGEAYAQGAKIVGTGAATCATFVTEIVSNPISEREYFSWAQGYMSALLLRAPTGTEVDLDLTPPEFPVRTQLEFFRSFCSAYPQANYADAVDTLYTRLRNTRSR